jgi:tRNA pseudouridine38-40 synthase
MTTFKITVSYDGTDLVGWQRQASGTSVQGLLEDVLRELEGRRVTVHGAGRTDAGVHALGQVASFVLDRQITPVVLRQAMNAHLPETVRVLDASAAPAAFHARFDATARTYRYRIWNADVLDPFERAYAWHVLGPLDLDAMTAAARTLEGPHDFAAFQGSGGTAATTAREVYMSRACLVQRGRTGAEGRLIAYEVTGSGFLRHMVRTIVGSLIEIGRGRRDAAWLGELLRVGDRTRAGPTVPAHGLFLVGVDYGAGALADRS